MEWYQWLTLIGVPALLGVILVDIYNRIKAESKTAKEQRRQEETEVMQEVASKVISPLLNPVNEKLDSLDKRLSVMETGTQASLRNDLLHSYRFCQSQGYRSMDDTESWERMYGAYKALGGNSFIDRLKLDFENLPTEEQHRRIRDRHDNESR